MFPVGMRAAARLLMNGTGGILAFFEIGRPPTNLIFRVWLFLEFDFSRLVISACARSSNSFFRPLPQRHGEEGVRYYFPS